MLLPHASDYTSKPFAKMKRIITTFFSLVLLFFTALVFGYVISTYGQIKVKGEKSEVKVGDGFSPTLTPTPDPLAPRNILILGYGGNGHEGGLLTDTMILSRIIPREKMIVFISIPRDLFIPLPVSSEEKSLKINHAYAIGSDDVNFPDKPKEYKGEAGGGNLAKLAVSYALGMSVDNFISVNFEGFKNIINILGGVPVNVPSTFDDQFYPVAGLEEDLCGKSKEEIAVLTATMSANLLEREFKCRYEVLHFERGLQTMDAETALKFVRSRHSETDGGDFARSNRQQALILGIKNKMFKLGSLTKIIPLVNSFAKNVRTDVDFVTSIDLLREQGLFSDVNIKSISLSTDNVLKEVTTSDGQYVLIPKGGEENWSEVHDFIKENLDD